MLTPTPYPYPPPDVVANLDPAIVAGVALTFIFCVLILACMTNGYAQPVPKGWKR